MTNAVMVTMIACRLSRMPSLTVRPSRKPERATGSDRKRSIIPVCMSSAMPMPDWMPANTIVCTRTAGTTKSL